MRILKRLSYRSPYERWMFVVVAIAALLRLILIYNNYPITNSDEGNMGLVALHVAYNGDHPIFFYGLPYLGPVEGYVAAFLFHLFSPSLFTLRLALLPFHVGFLISMYYLVRLLCSEKFALASVMLLSLGSSSVIFLQIRAVGEYPELEMFAALICLLVVSLALSSHLQKEEWKKRTIIYAVLGLSVGLATWIDFLILPFVAMGVLLLLLFCRWELMRWPGLSLLLGIIIGVFPLIYYNLTALVDQNSWNILLFIHRGGAGVMVAQHLTWRHQLSGTIMIALPLATGVITGCPVNAFPPFVRLTQANLPCVLIHGAWSLSYLVLWCIVCLSALLIIWRYRRHLLGGVAQDAVVFEEQQEAIRQCGRLLLLISALITVGLYVISPSAAVFPDSTYRYLACLLLTIPILLWPLWQGLYRAKFCFNWRIVARVCLSGGTLLLIATAFLYGTVKTFQEIPMAQAVHQSEVALIKNLLRVGATRIYSEYWTCNRLTFDTQEKIVCAVVDDQLRPGFDRYLPYRGIVHAAAHPAYVFPLGANQIATVQHRIAASHLHYQKYTFDGYVVYFLT